MKLLIFSCLIFLTIAAGCNSDADKADEQKLQEALKLERQQDIKKLKEMMRKYEYPNFHYVFDNRINRGHFSVETKIDLKKREMANLWLKIMDDGELFFASVYSGPNRLYHTKIQAQIGNSVVTSDEISPGTKRFILEGNTETAWFFDMDNGILDAIISSKENEKITIKLLGIREFSYTLSKEDVNKLKDAASFAYLLKYLQLSEEEKKREFGY